MLSLTILAQGLHFLEELRTEFFARFPEAFGFAAFSRGTFIGFNVAWLAIWVAALLAARSGLSIGLFPLWFLGLAMVLNGVAHPLLAWRAGGYFPGLLTAPLVGVLGILALRELARATAAESSPAGPA